MDTKEICLSIYNKLLGACEVVSDPTFKRTVLQYLDEFDRIEQEDARSKHEQFVKEQSK